MWINFLRNIYWTYCLTILYIKSPADLTDTWLRGSRGCNKGVSKAVFFLGRFWGKNPLPGSFRTWQKSVVCIVGLRSPCQCWVIHSLQRLPAFLGLWIPSSRFKSLALQLPSPLPPILYWPLSPHLSLIPAGESSLFLKTGPTWKTQANLFKVHNLNSICKAPLMAYLNLFWLNIVVAIP